MSASPPIATAKADLANGHVCFTPESGHVQRTSSCLFRAISGHEPLSLDYLVGAPDKRVRHREAECFRGPKIDDEFNLGGLLDR
jgi:hypothetical protein